MRMFFAIELPPDVRSAIADATAGHRGPRWVRWVAADALHVTLKFLGEVGEERAHAVEAAGQGAIAPFESVPVRVRGGGAFPDARRPRIMWLAMEDEGRLGLVAAAIDAALEPLGFPGEKRPFHPHVTVARVRSGPAAREAEALARTGEIGSFTVREVVLLRSELRPEGARYTTVAAFPLR